MRVPWSARRSNQSILKEISSGISLEGNRFKDIDVIDRVPDELCNEVHDIVQETGIKTIPMGKKMQKSKMSVWGSLTNSCEEKRSEKPRRK